MKNIKNLTWDPDDREGWKGTVLDIVNNMRMAMAIGEGKLPELPKGLVGNPNQCVLARALSADWNVQVDGCYIELWPPEVSMVKRTHSALERMGFSVMTDEYDERVEIKTPDILADFIDTFDEQGFPELIAKR